MENSFIDTLGKETIENEKTYIFHRIVIYETPKDQVGDWRPGAVPRRLTTLQEPTRERDRQRDLKRWEAQVRTGWT